MNCGFVSVEIPDNCIEAIPRHHCALEDFFFCLFTPTAKLNSGFSANLYFHKMKCVPVFSASLGLGYQSESCLAKFTARNSHRQRLREDGSTGGYCTPLLPPLDSRSTTVLLWTFRAGCRGRVADSPSAHPVLLAVDAPSLQMQPTQALKHRLTLHTRREQENNLLFNSLT